MPPDALPPNDEREPDPSDANVVDPEVLAERRAQRAEHAERSATRRAADAQTLAAELARERARLEAERDAARAEAAAAREGADAVKGEAHHIRTERDALRGEVESLRAELARAREAAGAARPSNGHANGNGHAGGPPAAWATGLRRELAIARGVTARPPLLVVAAARPVASAPMPALARERGLVARRVAAAPVSGPAFGGSPLPSAPRPGERATPATALALERERSGRLQAQLERAAEIERELREQVAALQRAVDARREAEERIEAALRRVRAELESAQEVEARSALGPPHPVTPVTAPLQAPAVGSVGLAIDAERLNAARERLRAENGEQLEAARPAQPAPPAGPPSAWLPNALRRLARDDPRTAGRMLAGLLPAQGLVARRELRYDLVLAGRGCIAVDLGEGGARLRPREQPRARREVDLRIATDDAGFARLLLGRRSFVRRRARVRGSHRRLRELRRMAQEPLALRDLARAGTTLDPVLTLMLTALAIDPLDTCGHRFTVAHAPLAGGAPDAWLQIQDGSALAVLGDEPAEAPQVTIRSTRGGLLPALAGVEPPPGDAAAIDGDAGTLALLRSWIARTEARGA